MNEASEEQATINLAVIVERIKNFQEENKQQFCTLFEQVKKTNGSVADIQKWRFMITGALVIMNIILVPVIVSILIKFATSYFF